MFRGCGHRWHHGAQVFAVTLTQLAQPGRGFRHLDQPAQTMAVGAVAEVPQHPARRLLAVASASICRATAGRSAKTVIRRIRKALSGSSPCESFIARTGHLPAPGQRRPEAGLPVKAAQATGTAFVEDRHIPAKSGCAPQMLPGLLVSDALTVDSEVRVLTAREVTASVVQVLGLRGTALPGRSRTQRLLTVLDRTARGPAAAGPCDLVADLSAAWLPPG